jgi:maltooligosyltrehalose trehalohydrolase
VSSPWPPTLGAWPDQDGARFRVWAPAARSVELIPEGPRHRGAPVPLARDGDGFFTARLAGFGPGDRYRYRVDGNGPFPDPASRFQPEGVHGPSEIVDPTRFAWTDGRWRGVRPDELVIYELHVGTFTLEGTFAAAAQRLPALAELGVTAVEIMPVADFPGTRNWGYDGVSLFAPARCYGTPDDLRRLVDEAHRLGLAVLLDVVYNHLGPDGNYLGAFSPYYFNAAHQTPWGGALNFGGAHSGPVREFFLQNALHWLHEYHLDGLRLDAIHAIVDEGPRHIIAELAARVHADFPERPRLLTAEDDGNRAALIRPAREGGWGLDSVWADDFHHHLRRRLAGDHESYFQDFTGDLEDIAATLRQGWFFTGQHSRLRNGPRGTDPAGLPPSRFIVCIQNHDQVGNRALGDRLNHNISPAAYRAASALLLCAPQTPLLFMGQEWAASVPFQFFTDHHEELGRGVTHGRRNEFKGFASFNDPTTHDRIPDPQAESTFRASQLDWSERERPPHAGTLRLYRDLLRLRRTDPALRGGRHDAAATDAGAIVLRRTGADGSELAVVVALTPEVTARGPLVPGAGWDVLLTTEDPPYGGAQPPTVDPAKGEIRFTAPAAVILRKRR